MLSNIYWITYHQNTKSTKSNTPQIKNMTVDDINKKINQKTTKLYQSENQKVKNKIIRDINILKLKIQIESLKQKIDDLRN